jgi:hypothetical protein
MTLFGRKLLTINHFTQFVNKTKGMHWIRQKHLNLFSHAWARCLLPGTLCVSGWWFLTLANHFWIVSFNLTPFEYW